MKGNNTIKKWQEFSEKISVKELIENINKLPKFQTELANYINTFCSKGKKIIEVGCEFGLTSLILDDKFDKYLLDFDGEALKKAKQVFDFYGKKAHFIEEDMFNMSFYKKFDIIFNAGVLEHFNFEERKKLLGIYSKNLKDDGILIIAVTNHYNLLYRIMYKILVLTGKWSFPKENKIYDLGKEIEENGLVLLKRETVDKENIFTMWGKLGKLMKIIFGRFMKEGYLTILTIKKK